MKYRQIYVSEKHYFIFKEICDKRSLKLKPAAERLIEQLALSPTILEEEDIDPKKKLLEIEEKITALVDRNIAFLKTHEKKVLGVHEEQVNNFGLVNGSINSLMNLGFLKLSLITEVIKNLEEDPQKMKNIEKEISRAVDEIKKEM